MKILFVHTLTQCAAQLCLERSGNFNLYKKNRTTYINSGMDIKYVLVFPLKTSVWDL